MMNGALNGMKKKVISKDLFTMICIILHIHIVLDVKALILRFDKHNAVFLSCCDFEYLEHITKDNHFLCHQLFCFSLESLSF